MKNKESVVRFSGLLNIIGGTVLLAWWFMMPLFLPVSEAATDFSAMVLHPNWIPVNVVGLAGILFLTSGFSGMFLAGSEKTGKLGLAGWLLALTGLILYTAIQYYETFIWPAAAQVNPELVQVGGVLINGDKGVMAGLVASGIFLGLGYILWAAVSIQRKTLPVWLAIFLFIGATVFGNGILFSIRTVGILLFCPATILIGIRLRKAYFKPETS